MKGFFGILQEHYAIAKMTHINNRETGKGKHIFQEFQNHHHQSENCKK